MVEEEIRQELDMQASFFDFQGTRKCLFLLSKIEKNKSGSVGRSKGQRYHWLRRPVLLTGQARNSEEQRGPVAGGFCISGERMGCRRQQQSRSFSRPEAQTGAEEIQKS